MLRLKVTGFIVKNVPATVSFYERAFGLPLHYMHPSHGYAELNTGAAVLAFLSEDFVEKAALLGGMPTRANRLGLEPIAAQIALWSDDIKNDWEKAVSAGAKVVKALESKPWGQTSGYLLDTDGILVELCTHSPRPMPADR
jgi:lactoylglutathione lyase